MKPGQLIYFLSDFHLGVPDAASSLAREKRICAFLEEAAKDAAEIHLLGDLFDFWFEWRKAVPRGHVRLLGKLADLRVEVDQDRFEQELVYYLEKLDITEEKVRLRGHCDYFRETLAADEAQGRKLGFIAQEMGREINTLGSKANDAGMQRLVVRMKDELEKIKEQVLNVL